MEKIIYSAEQLEIEEEKGIDARTKLRQNLIRLSSQLLEMLATAQHNIVDEKTAEIKSALNLLLPANDGKWLVNDCVELQDITNFFLCCVALASADDDAGVMMSWVPNDLSDFAAKAITDLSKTVYSDQEQNLIKVSSSYQISYHDKGLDLTKISYDKRLILELMPITLPLLKDAIKSTCSNYKDDGLDEFIPSASKSSAIIASHQMRWCLKQVKHPYLGPSCALIIPCALTALDHWSPDVKVQAMSSFVHLANNLNSTELGWYKDAILDASCRSIPGSEQFWQSVMEISVTLVICIEGKNPRAHWYRELLGAMLGEMERHSEDKERRIIWLQQIEPLFKAMGLVILAFFKRLFPLLFHWLHAKDDATVILVLKRVLTITKLTWIRKTPYIERLVEELVLAHKTSWTRKSGSELRDIVVQILELLKLCKGLQFEEAWRKYKDDSISLPSSDNKHFLHSSHEAQILKGVHLNETCPTA
ncbi:uncharacterized protein At2g39910 isoform X2 [Cryptomeria japonica]|uniref:uncharacterized protein At2g39910 isoform X2 n=1 Tax=Cryptomeria japonica TaxID=3369 RepID=UPI0025ABE749|nr:uncharacterized protein At2g39910 isoform X2 [Cryptomeria japonica]